jgi:hypothetical protein
MTDIFELELPVNSVGVITMAGLVGDDTYLVEYQHAKGTCEDSAEVYVPFSPNGCQWRITAAYNPIKLDTPGKYRVVAEGAPVQTATINSKVYPIYPSHATF